MPLPQIVVLASVDPDDGTLQSITRLRDTCEGVIALGSDGHIYVSHSARLSSIFYYQINPTLPDFLQIPGPPQAGISSLEPMFFLDQVVAGIGWVRDLNAQALADLSQGDTAAASTGVRRGCAQLLASAESLLEDADDEIPKAAVDAGHDFVLAARDRLAAADAVMDENAAQASQEIQEAQSSLEEVLVLLSRTRVHLDILPGACPNLLNTRVRSRGTVDVAVLGTTDFEAWKMNLVSLTLSRDDRIGGLVKPLQRRRGPAIRFADVAAPFDGGRCECRGLGADGIVDRVLTFSAREIVDVLELGSLVPGERVLLKLSGSLIDGTPFSASDCVVIARTGE